MRKTPFNIASPQSTTPPPMAHPKIAKKDARGNTFLSNREFAFLNDFFDETVIRKLESQGIKKIDKGTVLTRVKIIKDAQFKERYTLKYSIYLSDDYKTICAVYRGKGTQENKKEVIVPDKHILGKGSFARVKLGVNIRTKQPIAIKIAELSDEQSRTAFEREVRGFKKVEEHYVTTKRKKQTRPKKEALSLEKTAYTEKFLVLPPNANSQISEKGVIITPLYNMTLTAFVEKRKSDQKPLSVEEKLNIALLIMLNYKQKFYDKKLLHRDLKGENIMLATHESGALYPKIIDFGTLVDIKDGSEDLSLFEKDEVTLMNKAGKQITFEAIKPKEVTFNENDEDATVEELLASPYEITSVTSPAFAAPESKPFYEELPSYSYLSDIYSLGVIFESDLELNILKSSSSAESDFQSLTTHMRQGELQNRPDPDQVIAQLRSILKNHKRQTVSAYSLIEDCNNKLEEYLSAIDKKIKPPQKEPWRSTDHKRAIEFGFKSDIEAKKKIALKVNRLLNDYLGLTDPTSINSTIHVKNLYREVLTAINENEKAHGPWIFHGTGKLSVILKGLKDTLERNYRSGLGIKVITTPPKKNKKK